MPSPIGASGSQAVGITGYEAQAGEYAVVAGNDQPTYVTAATVAAGDTMAVTLHEANKFATEAGAASLTRSTGFYRRQVSCA